LTSGTTDIPAATAVPADVPADLVYAAGITSSASFLASPHAFMADLHDKAPPIFFDPGGPHFPPSWQILKYDDAYFVLRHPEYFTTKGTGPFPRDPDDYWRIIPLEIDPPDHRKYRALVDPLVSPKAIAQMEASIRRLATELIDQFAEQGRCEFAQDFGRPLPVGVFLDLMGLPRSMMDEFVRWAMGLLHAQDRQVAVQVMAEVTEYLQSVIRDKAMHPDGLAVSAIVNGRPGGEEMSPRETFGFVFFLFIAGLDTVFATLNNVFVWLAQNPDRQREIRATPANIPNVVEELLRAFSVTFSGRTLIKDLELRGVHLKKGDKVTSVLPACNYDPEVFADPRKIDFHRPRKPILAFGGGVHSCMGAHLARLEMKICIEEFLRRIPEFSLPPGFSPEYWPGGVVGPKRVPLMW
jgi:cytochrome P450